MSAEDALKSKFTGVELAFSQFRDNHRIVVPAAKLFEILAFLKNEQNFDMLAEVTAVDYLEYEGAKDRFGVVYVLVCTTRSLRHVRNSIFRTSRPATDSDSR